MSAEDQEQSEKLNRLEELKSKLFSKNFPAQTEHRDSLTPPKRLDVPDSWARGGITPASPERFFSKTSVFKKFFFSSLIFFVLALGYAAYMFFAGGNTVSGSNIDISVLGNTFTAGGEELSLMIEVTNRNKSALEMVDLLVEYPKSSGDFSSNTERLRQSLGTIPAGSVRSENIKVVLFGEQSSTRPIRIRIEYRVSGSNAIFVKEKEYEVSISSTPIDLSISAPDEASPNQDFTLDIKASQNATKTVSGVLLQVDYPAGFQFVSASPAPAFGNNVWDLGDLSPGAESSVSIKGKMLDVFDGEEKTFRVMSGLQSERVKGTIETIFNSLGHTVLIKKAVIEARLYINGVYSREYAVNSNSSVQGEIRWANNLETKINDLEIRAKISGSAANRKSIDVDQGFYNSLEDVIVWDKNSDRDFAEVNPGESGEVSFSFGTLSLFSAQGGVLAQPEIKIDVSISGKEPLAGNDLKEVSNKESKVIRIISDVGFAAKILYYSGPFSNKGPIPPKAETETTYTVSWSLSNTSNNISGAKIRSTLPPWARFIGPISPPTEDLTYNSGTKEIIWNAGNIPKGTGITAGAKTVAFQIGFTPSLSQVGATPTLVNDAVLTGHDDFANVEVRVNKASLNTRLSSDPLFPANGDRVVE